MIKRIVVASLFLVLLVACGTSQPVTEATMVMTEFGFSPEALTVLAGQPVALALVNDGQIEHDFVVERIAVSSVSVEGSVGGHHLSDNHAVYDLHISVEAGGTGLLKFTASEPGTYRIFCSVEGHADAGMVAELRVVSE